MATQQQVTVLRMQKTQKPGMLAQTGNKSSRVCIAVSDLQNRMSIKECNKISNGLVLKPESFEKLI